MTGPLPLFQIPLYEERNACFRQNGEYGAMIERRLLKNAGGEKTGGGHHEKGHHHFPYDGQSPLLQAQPVLTTFPDPAVVSGAITDSPGFSPMTGSLPFFPVLLYEDIILYFHKNRIYMALSEIFFIQNAGPQEHFARQAKR
jgi:hypothetical protein